MNTNIIYNELKEQLLLLIKERNNLEISYFNKEITDKERIKKRKVLEKQIKEIRDQIEKIEFEHVVKGIWK